MSRYGKVAVLYGGQSSERAVSLKSGQAVLAALKARGVDAHGIDVGPDLAARLAEGYERAFIALHGQLGEDGCVQGLLEVMGMPYTGSGVAASAVAMDKMLTKAVLRAAALPTPDFRVVHDEADLAAVTALGLPLFLKPVSEGSSIGVSKVLSPSDLVHAFHKARAYGPVLAEACITGAEYTCAILGDRTLPVIRLETTQPFYDYEAKYLLNTTRYHCPAGLSAEEERAMQALAWTTFQALGARGWGRVDIMTAEDGTPSVLELNTVPGLTDHSLVPMAARAAGLSFEDLVLAILSETLEAQ